MKLWKKIRIIMLVTVLTLTVGVFRLPQRLLADNSKPQAIADLTDMGALEALVVTTGAAVVDGEVQFYSIIENRYVEMDELEEILLDVAFRLQISEGNIEKAQGATYRVLDLIGKSETGSQTHVVVQSNPGDNDTLPPQTYLLVICRDSSVEKLTAAVETLSAALQPYAANGQISYYLTGEISGRAADEDMVSKAKNALAAVEAQVIDGVEQKELVSYTAYTPLLDKHLVADGDRFNLNIAIRYDNYRNKTIVWAGFPLIHDPY